PSRHPSPIACVLAFPGAVLALYALKRSGHRSGRLSCLLSYTIAVNRAIAITCTPAPGHLEILPVTLSEAKGLSRSAARSFAALRMTGLDLAVAEELSRACEPCLNKFFPLLTFTPSSLNTN